MATPESAQRDLLREVSGYELRNTGIDHHTINYVTGGSGPPVVLVHGANVGWGQWYRNLAHLAQYRTVYAPDMPGSGFSSPVDFNTVSLDTCFVDTLQSFVDALGIDAPDFIGHSLGAWTVLNYVLRGNAAGKLVLVGPLGLSANAPLQYRLASIKWLAHFLASVVMTPSFANMEKFTTSIMHKSRSKPSAQFTRYMQAVVQSKPQCHPFRLLNRLATLTQMRPELDLRNELHEIQNSVLIIQGDADPLTPLTEIQSGCNRIPHAMLTVAQNTGHLPQLEVPELFNETVKEFLNTR